MSAFPLTHPHNEGKANSVDPMVNSGRSIGYHNDFGASGPFGLTSVGKRRTLRRRKGPAGWRGPFIQACCRTCGEAYY
jgi:hypothetical protein